MIDPPYASLSIIDLKSNGSGDNLGGKGRDEYTRVYKSVQWIVEMEAIGHTIPDTLRERE